MIKLDRGENQGVALILSEEEFNLFRETLHTVGGDHEFAHLYWTAPWSGQIVIDI